MGPAPDPRDPRQQRAVATVLEAAARATARRGDAASMGDVAADAGVARATLGTDRAFLPRTEESPWPSCP